LKLFEHLGLVFELAVTHTDLFDALGASEAFE